MATTAKKAAKESQDVIIEQPGVFRIGLEIEGTAPLLQSCFSQKTLEQMLRKHMGITTHREPKKPRQLIDQATVRNTEGRVCIPPMAIKKAMLSAASLIKAYKKTQLRIGMFVEGQSLPITYTSMEPRMDMVRNASGVPDVRFRPEFSGWKCRVIVRYYDLYNATSVVDLLSRAGCSGVGEWRPERDGTFGTFALTRQITAKAELDEVAKECAVPLVGLRIPDWAMDAELDDAIMAKIAGSQESHGPAAGASSPLLEEGETLEQSTTGTLNADGDFVPTPVTSRNGKRTKASEAAQ